MGLSQSGFAALVGVTSNTVARWERGELGMRATTQRLLELIAAQSPQKTKRKKEA
jgi:DNA-binding transcriptional regulator YiaG